MNGIHRPSEKGKLDNIKQELRRMKTYILGHSEVRWKGAGSIASDEFTIAYSGAEVITIREELAY